MRARMNADLSLREPSAPRPGRQHAGLPARVRVAEAREHVGERGGEVALLAGVGGDVEQLLAVAGLQELVSPRPGGALNRALAGVARAPVQRSLGERAAEAPPAASMVAVQSMVMIVSSDTRPAGIVPGQRTNAGTRIPPSQSVAFMFDAGQLNE